MVRELSKHQGAFLFDCCVFIARFASSSCYSSAKTRIRPVKSYQINESFCSITRCALLHIVYRFIVVSTRFRCPELQVRPLSSPRYRAFEPEPKPAFESHFTFPTLPIFVLFFYLNNYSLREPPLHTPRFFLFSRPTFATSFRDSQS